eukprot:CAMPEP_0177606758 /NCGR_PEP_ID=MMETSP0419_2-20121207/17492_1 /TAXON_ID=582737 /ORGANISM="Tetraselmis sp., Strain GSL018" /LENGTH=318 /DNA_ID=CAMNT_0019101169 /DNA_START=169 /DNA_END=1125 /DNA_ORIENTATION=+
MAALHCENRAEGLLELVKDTALEELRGLAMEEDPDVVPGRRGYVNCKEPECRLTPPTLGIDSDDPAGICASEDEQHVQPVRSERRPEPPQGEAAAGKDAGPHLGPGKRGAHRLEDAGVRVELAHRRAVDGIRVDRAAVLGEVEAAVGRRRREPHQLQFQGQRRLPPDQAACEKDRLPKAVSGGCSYSRSHHVAVVLPEGLQMQFQDLRMFSGVAGHQALNRLWNPAINCPPSKRRLREALRHGATQCSQAPFPRTIRGFSFTSTKRRFRPEVSTHNGVEDIGRPRRNRTGRRIGIALQTSETLLERQEVPGFVNVAIN